MAKQDTIWISPRKDLQKKYEDRTAEWLIERAVLSAPDADDAFEAMIYRFRNDLLNFAKNKGVDHAEAMDLVQEVFYKLRLNFDPGRKDASVNGFLFKTLANKVKDRWKERTYRTDWIEGRFGRVHKSESDSSLTKTFENGTQSSLLRDAVAPGGDLRLASLAEEEREALRSCLFDPLPGNNEAEFRLSADDFQVVMMHVFLDQQQAEIRANLEVGVGALRSRLSRALRKLRKCMDGKLGILTLPEDPDSAPESEVLELFLLEAFRRAKCGTQQFETGDIIHAVLTGTPLASVDRSQIEEEVKGLRRKKDAARDEAANDDELEADSSPQHQEAPASNIKGRKPVKKRREEEPKTFLQFLEDVALALWVREPLVYHWNSQTVEDVARSVGSQDAFNNGHLTVVERLSNCCLFGPDNSRAHSVFHVACRNHRVWDYLVSRAIFHWLSAPFRDPGKLPVNKSTISKSLRLLHRVAVITADKMFRAQARVREGSLTHASAQKERRKLRVVLGELFDLVIRLDDESLRLHGWIASVLSSLPEPIIRDQADRRDAVTQAIFEAYWKRQNPATVETWRCLSILNGLLDVEHIVSSSELSVAASATASNVDQQKDWPNSQASHLAKVAPMAEPKEATIVPPAAEPREPTKVPLADQLGIFLRMGSSLDKQRAAWLIGSMAEAAAQHPKLVLTLGTAISDRDSEVRESVIEALTDIRMVAVANRELIASLKATSIANPSGRVCEDAGRALGMIGAELQG